MQEPEEIAVTLEVAQELERLGIAYFVGGSLATSLHGMPRATADADLVADLRAEHVAPLVSALEERFYVDEDAVRDAIRRRASFNLIHLETMFKVDVFVLPAEAFSRERLARRQRIDIGLVVASPEDAVLQKLRWFRKGGETSERQWSDVLGVFKVQGNALDRSYLARWARDLGVEDLLARALADAGMG